MVIPPIPRYMLPHKCTHLKKASEDRWGKASAITNELSFVRIEPCHSHRMSLSADIPEVSAKMFFDAVNSCPQDVSFETGDIIRFMSRDYSVIKVGYFFTDSNKIHHLEVMLG